MRLVSLTSNHSHTPAHVCGKQSSTSSSEIARMGINCLDDLVSILSSG